VCVGVCVCVCGGEGEVRAIELEHLAWLVSTLEEPCCIEPIVRA